MDDLRDSDLREMKDRLRRMETRLTKFMIAQGFDTETRQPVWEPGDGTLEVPSAQVALQDVLDAIPSHRTHTRPIPITLGDRVLCRVWLNP